MSHPDPCPTCGFSGAHLSPADGVAALRSFPRRWRELLDAIDPATAPAGAEAAVNAQAAAAAVEIAGVAEDLRRVLLDDEPLIADAPDPEAPASAVGAGEGAGVGSLQRAAGDVAELAGSASGAAWKRTGRRPDGATTSALDVLAGAVHAGSHRLRAAARAAGAEG